MFEFHYQTGTARRKVFQVTGSHCSIGSARGNDLVVNSRHIAKRHAELREEHSGVYLRDFGSLGGCRVNGERVMDYGPLEVLDDIEVADVRINLRATAGRDTVTRAGIHGGADSGSYAGSHAGVHAGVHASAHASAHAGIQIDTHASSNNAAHTRTNAHNTVSKQVLVNDELNARSNAVNTNTVAPSDALANGSDQEGTTAVFADGALHDERMSYWCGSVHEQLLQQMDLRRKDVNRMSDAQLREESTQIIDEIINVMRDQLPSDLDVARLHQSVLNEAVGLGPLEFFLADESITEIMVNNHREIFVEQAGKLVRSSMQFSSDATVYAVIDRIITPLGRRIDESSPIVDARLKDGSRVNAVIPPLALKGPSLTIRKFPKHRMQFSQLVDYGTLSEDMVSFLRVCVERRKNIIVSGGTGSGKTTLLNVLSSFIPDTDRIVTIEDAAELSLHQPNLVSLESRPANLDDKGEVPIRDLVKNALRMRPDRIVVGECRGGEALDMLQAMNTGHDGSLTTIHANTPRDVLSRLEVLVLMAGMDLPVSAIREQTAAAVDIIIQQHRFTCGSRKITRITEVVGMESGTVQLQDIFRYEQRGVDEQHRVRGEFAPTGSVPHFYESLREFGVELELACFDNSVMQTPGSGGAW